MKTPQQFLEERKEVSGYWLPSKMRTLYDMLNRYQTMMSLSDADLMKENSNVRMLKEDPVYNSELATSQLREAIKTRSLGNITADEFENRYKRVLYRIRSPQKSGINTKAFRESLFREGYTPDEIDLFLKVRDKLYRENRERIFPGIISNFYRQFSLYGLDPREFTDKIFKVRDALGGYSVSKAMNSLLEFAEEKEICSIHSAIRSIRQEAEAGHDLSELTDTPTRSAALHIRNTGLRF